MGVEGTPLVAVRTMVGDETGSVRMRVGVEVVPEVGVRTMVGVDTASDVTVRVAVGAEVTVRVGVEVALEVTVRMSGAETAPGPGFATVMLTVPVCVAVPVAVSCVDELKVVIRGVPFHSTRAPLTKRLPMTVSVNGPRGSGFGGRPVVHANRVRRYRYSHGDRRGRDGNQQCNQAERQSSVAIVAICTHVRSPCSRQCRRGGKHASYRHLPCCLTPLVTRCVRLDFAAAAKPTPISEISESALCQWRVRRLRDNP